jgi:hypothetical protein
MLRFPASSTNLRRTTLACGLCLLAFLFAVEAKTAWYGPASGPGSVVRAAKALRIDSTNVVQHGMPFPDPIHRGIAFLFVTVFTAAWLAGADVSARYAVARRSIRVSEVVFSSPQTFFRPPPSVS